MAFEFGNGRIREVSIERQASKGDCVLVSTEEEAVSGFMGQHLLPGKVCCQHLTEQLQQDGRGRERDPAKERVFDRSTRTRFSIVPGSGPPEAQQEQC